MKKILLALLALIPAISNAQRTAEDIADSIRYENATKIWWFSSAQLRPGDELPQYDSLQYVDYVEKWNNRFKEFAAKAAADTIPNPERVFIGNMFPVEKFRALGWALAVINFNHDEITIIDANDCFIGWVDLGDSTEYNLVRASLNSVAFDDEGFIPRGMRLFDSYWKSNSEKRLQSYQDLIEKLNKQ